MKGIGKKIIGLFTGNTTTSDMSVGEAIEIKESQIDLLKSEITNLIEKIDIGEESYNKMISTTNQQIEKGFTGGEIVKESISKKHRENEAKLIKSLSQKKASLKSAEEELEELQKGNPNLLQCYSDSIVRNQNGEVLLLLRKQDDEFEPNKWGLPGGKIEAEEEPEIAASRELQEETNLTALSCTKLAEVNLPLGGTIHYYEVNVEEGEQMVALDSEEHTNYTFMSIEEIRRRPADGFILDLKSTLLQLLDPMYVHYNTIKKGWESKLVDNTTFNKAIKSYTAFKPFKTAEHTKKSE